MLLAPAEPITAFCLSDDSRLLKRLPTTPDVQMEGAEANSSQSFAAIVNEALLAPKTTAELTPLVLPSFPALTRQLQELVLHDQDKFWAPYLPERSLPSFDSTREGLTAFGCQISHIW